MEYYDALLGDGGCYVQAGKLESNFQNIFQEYEAEFSRMWEEYLSDERVIQANQDWSRCMREDGFYVKNLDELKLEIATIFEQAITYDERQDIQQYEIAAALANIECSDQAAEVYSLVIIELPARSTRNIGTTSCRVSTNGDDVDQADGWADAEPDLWRGAAFSANPCGDVGWYSVQFVQAARCHVPRH